MRYIEPLDCYECGLNDENLGGTVKVATRVFNLRKIIKNKRNAY